MAARDRSRELTRFLHSREVREAREETKGVERKLGGTMKDERN